MKDISTLVSLYSFSVSDSKLTVVRIVEHFEHPPYTNDSMRSIYHLRELELVKIRYLYKSRRNIDVFLSHDWPQDIWEHGDKNTLLRIKPYFKDDMDKGQLGSPPLKEVLEQLKPEFWFAAHLHVKFPAVFVHPQDSSDSPQQDQFGFKRSSVTKFLALDKVIPGR
jgi:lariat debranching enzyme